MPIKARSAAALYRTTPCFNPITAAVPAATDTANNAIGAASLTPRCKKYINNGSDRIAPPAPVMDIRMPINTPNMIAIRLGSIMIF